MCHCLTAAAEEPCNPPHVLVTSSRVSYQSLNPNNSLLFPFRLKLLPYYVTAIPARPRAKIMSMACPRWHRYAFGDRSKTAHVVMHAWFLRSPVVNKVWRTSLLLRLLAWSLLACMRVFAPPRSSMLLNVKNFIHSQLLFLPFRNGQTIKFSFTSTLRYITTLLVVGELWLTQRRVTRCQVTS